MSGDTGATRAGSSRYARNFLKVGAANLFAQALPLLLAPLLTRLYRPEDYGVVAVFGALVALATAASGMRLDWMVSSSRAPRRAGAFLRLGVVWGAAATLLVLLATAVAAPLVRARGHETLAGVLWLVPVMAATSTLFQLVSAWFVRQAALGPVARARIVQSVALSGANLAGGLAGGGAFAMAAAQLVGSAAGLGRLVRATPMLERPTPLGRRAVRATLRRSHRRVLVAGATGLVNTAGLFLPALLIGLFFSSAELGWFALVTRVAAGPSQVVTNAIMQSFWGEVTTLRAGSGGDLRAIFYGSARRLLLLSLAVAAVCAGAPLYVGPVFGTEQWAQAGWVLLALAPYLCTQVVVSPLSSIVTIYGYERWLFVWDSARTAAVVAVFVLAHRLAWPFTTAVLAFALVMAATYLALFGKMTRIVARHSAPTPSALSVEPLSEASTSVQPARKRA